MGNVPMHVETGNNSVQPCVGRFVAQEKATPPVSQSGPSFNDQWANLVGQNHPRPRKRPRSGDFVCSEVFVGHEGVSGGFDPLAGGYPIKSVDPVLDSSNDKGDINLNVDPSLSSVPSGEHPGVVDGVEASVESSPYVNDTQDRNISKEVF
ncbi:hypothetical protein Hanom_Chr11g01049311 [Helianthus anomalus]